MLLEDKFSFGDFGQFSGDMFVLDRAEHGRGRERRTGKEKDLISGEGLASNSAGIVRLTGDITRWRGH